VDLVGRNVDETEPPTFVVVELGEVLPGRLQQRQGSTGIGVEEGRRTVDRTVDVRLRRQVIDRRRALFSEEAGERYAVGNVRLDEAVARIVLYSCQATTVASVS